MNILLIIVKNLRYYFWGKSKFSRKQVSWCSFIKCINKIVEVIRYKLRVESKKDKFNFISIFSCVRRYQIFYQRLIFVVWTFLQVKYGRVNVIVTKLVEVSMKSKLIVENLKKKTLKILLNFIDLVTFFSITRKNLH